MRVLLSVLLFCVVIVQISIGFHGPDAGNYLGVAERLGFDRSLMIDPDMAGNERPFTITPTGYAVEMHQIGAPLVWAAVIDIQRLFGIGRVPGLFLAVKLAEVGLSLLALFFMFLSLRYFFDKKTSVWALAAVLCGTNLFAYLFLLNGSAHIASVATVSFFVWYFLETRRERKLLQWFILGLIGGSMFLTRGETAIYLFLILPGLVSDFFQKKTKTVIFSVLIFLGGFAFLAAIQIGYWQVIFGTLIRPYAEADFFTGQKYAEVLFSASRGFFFFSPVLIICFFIGLKRLFQRDRLIAATGFVVFFVLLVAIGRAKFGWWQGDSFGNRYFFTLMPLFVLAVGAVFEKVRFPARVLITVFSLFWSFFLFLLYILGRELDSWINITHVVNRELVNDLKYSLLRLSEDILKGPVILYGIVTLIFLVVVFVMVQWLYRLSRNSLKRDKVFVVSMVVFALWAGYILLNSYFRDRKLLAELRARGFYQNVVFGLFDKADIAEAYSEYTVEAIRDGRKEEALWMLFRSARLYPPLAREKFISMAEVYEEQKDLDFQMVFLKYANSAECNLLSEVFAERDRKKEAEFFREQALKKK